MSVVVSFGGKERVRNMTMRELEKKKEKKRKENPNRSRNSFVQLWTAS